MSKPTPPRCIRGFEHINRFWDNSRQLFLAKILPGQYYVTENNELIGTVLGSCVSACICDPITGIGGMNHFMLPETKEQNPALLSDAFRYGNFAMEHLINDILKFSGRRERLQIKIFGGGQVVPGMGRVGDLNINFVRRYLEMEGFRIAGEDLGGNYPRKIVFSPRDGKVWMKRIESLHNETIIARELNYQSELKQKPVAGEIDLF